jgi:chromosome segregation ATPase
MDEYRIRIKQADEEISTTAGHIHLREQALREIGNKIEDKIRLIKEKADKEKQYIKAIQQEIYKHDLSIENLKEINDKNIKISNEYSKKIDAAQQKFQDICNEIKTL